VSSIHVHCRLISSTNRSFPRFFVCTERNRERAGAGGGEGGVAGGKAPPWVQEPVPDLRGVRHRRGGGGGAGDGDRAPHGRQARRAHRLGRQHQHHHQPPLMEPRRANVGVRGVDVILCHCAATTATAAAAASPAGALHAPVRARHGGAGRRRRHGQHSRTPASKLATARAGGVGAYVLVARSLSTQFVMMTVPSSQAGVRFCRPAPSPCGRACVRRRSGCIAPRLLLPYPLPVGGALYVAIFPG
jgi:hypothetical protein